MQQASRRPKASTKAKGKASQKGKGKVPQKGKGKHMAKGKGKAEGSPAIEWQPAPPPAKAQWVGPYVRLQETRKQIVLFTGYRGPGPHGVQFWGFKCEPSLQ